MCTDVSNVLLEMIRNSARPIKSIADELGKPYSTLMRELDPEDRRAKLGVEMLLPLMQACGSTAPLRYLAEAMGYRLVSFQDIKPDKPTFHEEMLATYQTLAEYHRAMLEGEPAEVVGKRREMLIREIKEDFVFYVSRARGQEGTSPPFLIQAAQQAG